MADRCWCGVVSAATCLRCGKEACGDHYALEVTFTSTATMYSRTPNGELTGYWGDRDLAWVQAYAAGGPGCTTCRSAAADAVMAPVLQQAADEREQLIWRVAARPTDADMRALVPMLRKNAPSAAESARLAAAVMNFVLDTYTREIITVHLRRPQGLLRRNTVEVHVSERIPVWGGPADAWLSPDGDLFSRRIEHRVLEQDPTGQFLIARGGKPPAFTFSPATHGWGADSPASFGLPLQSGAEGPMQAFRLIGG